MKRVFAAFITVMSAVAVESSVIAASIRPSYRNNFTVRTSGDVPSGRWMETSYVPGALARSVNSVSDNKPYTSAKAFQDGWSMKEGYEREAVTFTVADDDGNQGVLVNATTTSYNNEHTVVMQPFYNEFKDGILKISVDMRTPAQTDSFNPLSNALALFSPIYKSALEVESSSFGRAAEIGVGSLRDNRESVGTWMLRTLAVGRKTAADGVEYFGQYDSRNTVEAGSWVRYEAVLDLDAGTYTATFAELGSSHPSPGTTSTAPSAFCRWEGAGAPTAFAFENPLTEETGGIAGIAFRVQGLKNADAAAAPMFDNISVAWKAPGTDVFAAVYENDFSVRRYRTLEPAGTTAGSYVFSATTNAVTSSFYERALVNEVYSVSVGNSRRLVPAKTNDQGELEPVGQDGWRRIEGYNYHFTLVDPNKDSNGYGWSNGTVLRPTANVSGNNAEGYHAHGTIAAPLGTTLKSGKVRLYFDIMTAAKWRVPKAGVADVWACVYLGSAHDDTLIVWQNNPRTYLKKKVAFGGGFRGSSSTAGGEISNVNFAGVSSTGVLSDMGGWRGASRWYRFRMTADLDAKTYDWEVFYDDTQSGAPKGPAMDDTSLCAASKKVSVSGSSGRGFNEEGPSELDSVVISVGNACTYSQHTTRSGDRYAVGDYPLFDSIRVCRVNDDGSDGAEIYSCDFVRSVRTTVRDAAELAVSGRTDREGADNWIRRGPYGSVNVVDAGDGDGVAVIDDAPWYYSGSEYTAYAVQSLGTAPKNCARADFAADIRPPDRFARKVSSVPNYAYVEVGGDDYYQGVYRPDGSNWRKAPRIGFGFSNGSTQSATGQYNVLFSVETVSAAGESVVETSSVAVDPTRWYRFKVVAEPAVTGGTFSVDVYDQGVDKPSASDVDGALVTSFGNLTLPDFGGKGMTAFGLAGRGFSSSRGGGSDDPDVALVDNLSADFWPLGLRIMVR